METLPSDYIKGAIEAILFISEKPVALDQLKELIDTASGLEIKKIIKEMVSEYEENKRGMGVIEIAGGYQMLSSPHYSSYVRSFFKTRVKEKLTRPSLETLAIIAYKQPVSRADIEVIRGVNSDGVTTHLMNKGLIKIIGRKDVPGRPYLYGITKLFLEYFGLKSLQDLPKLEDFADAMISKAEKVIPLHDREQIDESHLINGEVVGSGEQESSGKEVSAQEGNEDAADAGESFEGRAEGDENISGEDVEESAEVKQDNGEPEVEEFLESDEGEKSDDVGFEDAQAQVEEALELKQVMDEINKGEATEGESFEQDRFQRISSPAEADILEDKDLSDPEMSGDVEGQETFSQGDDR